MPSPARPKPLKNPWGPNWVTYVRLDPRYVDMRLVDKKARPGLR